MQTQLNNLFAECFEKNGGFDGDHRRITGVKYQAVLAMGQK
jgi:hypothetical protein